MTTVGEIIGQLEILAPPSMAESWDSVGLQVGREGTVVDKVMVCLDVTQSIIEEAADQGCALVVAHHPLFFGDGVAVSDATAVGLTALKAAESGIAVYVAHTNLDKVSGGLNDILAEALELEKVQVLDASEALYKLVVFVPAGGLDRVKRALGDAGAGVIGLYSHCSFSSPGQGSFCPLPGAEPSIGEVGVMNDVDEYRLEVEIRAADVETARSAMLAAHPYEEVAHDIYELVNRDQRSGLGRVGDLKKSLPLDQFVDRCIELFTPEVRIAGDASGIHRVAVCGGSGASLISAAKASGADVLVTGDIKYHDAWRAVDMGMTVIDAGHDHTEEAALRGWCERLRDVLPIEIVQPAERRSVWRGADS